MFTLTLTPNREQNTPIFARSVRYERKGDKVTRVERTRARVRTIPMLNRGESKDWTGIPSGKATQALVTGSIGNRNDCVNHWLSGAAMSPGREDLRTVNIKPTAKRDWLILQGYITPGKALTQPKLEWCPGFDRVEFHEQSDSIAVGWFDSITGDEQPLSWEGALDGDVMIFGGDFYA